MSIKLNAVQVACIDYWGYKNRSSARLAFPDGCQWPAEHGPKAGAQIQARQNATHHLRCQTFQGKPEKTLGLFVQTVFIWWWSAAFIVPRGTDPCVAVEWQVQVVR